MLKALRNFCNALSIARIDIDIIAAKDIVKLPALLKKSE
jgi:hypothetical protein